uniref:Large ribosomal subunit protein bL35c n=1 Tax=Gracilaria tenuistipitata var. liui TaxID=285951 RepID=RK35_GRATL|nr:ribosomal protein L35 [Gracilaria tenuistipitata var. liui]Q6B8T5.1 RecName: Full=Large ribosomal subunit protein bL35c; AltName: Full=50S ribosomal protein L35, chloroplastic [Gracilaria tenuistipitata var. liui]AAT79700.1 50S ribosomal protein L35 [Gracilaria tenuistipitata var. liui]
MCKLRTSKSIIKRFKFKSKNKILRRMAGRSHLLQKKSSKRKQKLRKIVNLKKIDISSWKFRVPYID